MHHKLFNMTMNNIFFCCSEMKKDASHYKSNEASPLYNKLGSGSFCLIRL